MSARLFVAVDLSGEARRLVSGATGRLRQVFRSAGIDEDFRWVATGNLHVTLRFIGNVDEAAVAGVVRAMSAPFDVETGSIAFVEPATFPAKGRPRVLQLPLVDGAPMLSTLRDRVDARLAPLCTWEHESRPFAPHLTLARTRDRARFDVDRFRALLDAPAWPAVSMDVTEVRLFRSVTRPSGPEYSVLARAALRSR